MAERRTLKEGTLYWVMASGSGRTWGTASAAVSGLFGLVASMNYTSAIDMTLVSERGTPDHWKAGQAQAIDLSISLGWTGYIPTAVSGSGASVPMWHLEYKAIEPERGPTANTGRWLQWHGVPVNSIKLSESMDGDTLDFTLKALSMNGPTASGYII